MWSDMNPLLILFLLPVLTGLVWLLVAQNERRQQFVQQRLTKFTADDASEPVTVSLARKLQPMVFLQLPGKLAVTLSAAFEAAGNRVGMLHLLITGLISAIIVIVFTGRLLD